MDFSGSLVVLLKHFHNRLSFLLYKRTIMETLFVVLCFLMLRKVSLGIEMDNKLQAH